MPERRKPLTQRVPHEIWEEGTSRGIRIGPWEIETRKQSILNANEVDEATAQLDIPLPEITFGNNLVSLRRKGKQRAVDNSSPQVGQTASGCTSIVFHGLHALAQVDTTGEDTIKVSYADEWAKSRNLSNVDDPRGRAGVDTAPVIETVKNYDWTYTTTYSGTVTGEEAFLPAPSDHAGIPLAKLARQDEPILFFDEITLFEDELHDNGVANLTVRIRVMPSGIFLLCRFFLRVDNVLFRIHDVRLYHDLATSEIIRETKGKEAPYSIVKERLPKERPDDLTPLTDHNWVANVLGMLEKSQSAQQGVLANSTSTQSLPRLPSGAMQNAGEPIRAPMVKPAHQPGGMPVGNADYQSMQLRSTLPTPNRMESPKGGIILGSPSPAPTSVHSYGAKRPWTGLGCNLEVMHFL